MTLGNCALLAGLLWASAPPTPPAGPPNIVLIIADDLGTDDIGPYGGRARTPGLDRLAREGMRFDRAYVTASSCSPSRASLITGRYPHATGAAELHQPVPAGQVTFVEKLRAAGYWTAAAGKWHLGPALKDRFDVVREAKQGDPSGCGGWLPLLGERPRDRPFFLWLASFDPHRDYQAGAATPPHRPENVAVPPELPDTPEVRADLADYYDEIARLDGHVGAILDELDRQGIAEQTLVVFLSDNGRPFPRGKTTLYEAGIRTPLLARWPGHVPAGASCKALASTVDLAPTFLELAGAGDFPTGQGVGIAACLSDPAARPRHQVHAERNWHDFASHGRAVRDERYKYIRNDDAALPLTPPADAVRSPTFRAMRRLRDAGKLDPGHGTAFGAPRPPEELYDLDADPDERHNLADDPAHAEALARLRSGLAAWSRATGDAAAPDRLRPDEFDRETGQRLLRPAEAPRSRPIRPTPDQGSRTQ